MGWSNNQHDSRNDDSAKPSYCSELEKQQGRLPKKKSAGSGELSNGFQITGLNDHRKERLPWDAGVVVCLNSGDEF